MRGMLGDELPAFLAALESPAEGLRVNMLRLAPTDFERISPFDISRLEFAPEAYALGGEPRAGKHPYHAAGLYYLQDPGAMVVGALVDPQPGERVLDLSAAPGGKATHLAARMGGRGVLVANDVNLPRAQELVGNIERCGVRNAIVTAESPARLAAHFGASFDRVLVDAPCSGESMFHKSATARSDWSPTAVEGCSRRQSELIRTAAALVAPGGLLFYSTCTFSLEENEGVVESFLRENPDFEAAVLGPVAGAQAVSLGTAPPAPAATAYRLWPHHVAGAGHFIAALRRKAGDPESRARVQRPNVDPEASRLFAHFANDTFPDHRFDPARLAVFGQELYELPDPALDTRGLRVLRSGLWLGTLLKERFEPSHSLALAAPTLRSHRAADLALGDPRLARYLEGHPIDVSGDAGWTPITVDGFAIGWGKRVGTTVKNHYPKGLRRRA